MKNEYILNEGLLAIFSKSSSWTLGILGAVEF
jgi:hypothetical protein